MNIYQDSEEIISQLRTGKLPKRSIIRVQWPSGNSEAVRFHRWDNNRNVMIGCNMGWDNSAAESYELSQAVVSLIERAKEAS